MSITKGRLPSGQESVQLQECVAVSSGMVLAIVPLASGFNWNALFQYIVVFLAKWIMKSADRKQEVITEFRAGEKGLCRSDYIKC